MARARGTNTTQSSAKAARDTLDKATKRDRDPSREPYPSAWSDEERATLSGSDLSNEAARAVRKETLAKAHKDLGIFTAFVDPAASEASARATVGVALGKVSKIMDSADRSRKALPEARKNSSSRRGDTKATRDADLRKAAKDYLRAQHHFVSTEALIKYLQSLSDEYKHLAVGTIKRLLAGIRGELRAEPAARRDLYATDHRNN